MTLLNDEARPGEQLEAIIEETIFRNEENGYSVISVRTGKETCTAVGILPPLTPGEQVLLTGTWVEHPQYGRQFKCTNCQIRKPTSLLGIERFLSSGLIKGVGEATARLLVNAFGEDTLDAMTDVDKLKSLKGNRLDPVDACIDAHFCYKQDHDSEPLDHDEELTNYLTEMGW